MVLAEDPFATGIQIRLRRLTLDAIMQRFLSAIEAWQVKLIEEELPSRKHGSNNDDRQDHAVDADAGRFYRRDLVGTRHQTKSNQHGHQHRQRQQ